MCPYCSEQNPVTPLREYVRGLSERGRLEDEIEELEDACTAANYLQRSLTRKSFQIIPSAARLSLELMKNQPKTVGTS